MKYLIIAEHNKLSQEDLRSNFLVEVFDEITPAAKRHEELVKSNLYRFVYISRLVTYQVNYSDITEY